MLRGGLANQDEALLQFILHMVIIPKHNCTLKNKLDYLKVKQSCKC